MKYIKSLNIALDNLLSENNKIVLLGEDLNDPYGGAFKVTKGLSTKYPQQIYSTPISEGAIVGMAGGMSMSGIIPIIEIMFGDFLLLTIDQIMNHLTKYSWVYNGKVKTPITIRTAMGGRRGYGSVHSQSIEPVLSSIPLLNIISPSHFHNPGMILKNVVNDNNVSIFSEHKILYPAELIDENNAPPGLEVKSTNTPYPTVYVSNCGFDQAELLIISHGGNSLLIEKLMIELLMEYELNIECILPSLIKPFPLEDILEKIKRCDNILFIEESPKNNGWSNDIIADLAELNLLKNKDIKRIGALELPIPASMKLEEMVLPSKEFIKESIINWLSI